MTCTVASAVPGEWIMAVVCLWIAVALCLLMRRIDDLERRLFDDEEDLD